MGIRKQTLLIFTTLIISACSTHKTFHAPVKESQYFKNYALAICLGGSFNETHFNIDISKSLNGYIDKGSLGLEDYEEIRTFVKHWKDTTKTESKEGGQIIFIKCMNMYHSNDLDQLYKKLTPYSTLAKEWYIPENYYKNCL